MKRKIVAVLLAVSMMNTTLIGCGDNTVSKNEGLDLSAEDGDYDYVDWDGNELLSLLPDPNSSKVKSKQVDSNTARLIVYEVSKSGFNKYIELCADNGFSTDSKSVSDDTGAMYKATNDTGYSLTLAYDPDDKAMGIRIDTQNSSDQEEVDSTQTPTETPTPTEETTPEPTPTEESTPEPTPTEEVADEETDDADDIINNLSKSQKPASGVRQELKDYLDAYEDFAKEYAEFMKKYTDTNTVTNYDLDQDYKKLEDKAKKFSDAESKLYDNFDDLNSDEWDYFYNKIGDIYDEMYDY